jgi:hypothetical protein
VSFAPFTTNHHCGFCNNTMKGETKDVKFAGTGQLFRIIVADVRGKTIVIYLESNFADQPKFPPARIFPTFLPYARQMLSTLTFARLREVGVASRNAAFVRCPITPLSCDL